MPCWRAFVAPVSRVRSTLADRDLRSHKKAEKSRSYLHTWRVPDYPCQSEVIKKKKVNRHRMRRVGCFHGSAKRRRACTG
ncbi:hypothetical protein PSPO01_04509 [Paraphaeosphaeria sporulosa]